ncbi:hypothetical protein KsCSTR_01130 [Candidatus Kuenenia stuttgartiensis]|uniref:Uncharacterized protein n=1 Tax=Kuenenia stuttgartiensis TaxID=174633 RepID=A0A6G7GJF8_KUEST|nr:hypothetical protein [Candidatus Kuenenia stuttgartiensis]QII09492.1 hypothetical protein KsCSTR_01130 [Candidatus Kuenenia stuttgartiensis]
MDGFFKKLKYYSPLDIFDFTIDTFRLIITNQGLRWTNAFCLPKDPQADTLALEKQIDIMVYKLYGLTYEEVKIIEPEFTTSEAKYEAFEMK